MQLQTSSTPLLTAAALAELVALGRNRISQIYLHWTAGRYGPYSGDAETRWDLWYLRDSPVDGLMKPGGLVIRGKALWYAKSSPFA
ncbi:MAG: hypothetical protein Q4E98_04995 [Acidaminococcaceae bacterium]|nr:hypothetical protein [Acidaminococcaceae bacterium]